MRLKKLSRWFRRRFERGRPRLSVQFCLFDDGGSSAAKPNHYSLCLFGLWIRLWSTAAELRDCMMESWGFSYEGDHQAVHLNWGHRCKIVHMPWSLDYLECFVLCGTPSCDWEWRDDDRIWMKWEKYRRVSADELAECRAAGTRLNVENPPPEAMYTASALPFTYLHARGGKVTVTTADITDVTRRVWVRRWRKWRLFRWCVRWRPAKTSNSLTIKFADELGSEAGSWKGGVIGAGWDLKPNEHPAKALERMQCEHAGKFCR